jgi:hypothetical protein
MKFELESQKLELGSCAQAQITQFAIANMVRDIIHASK